MNTIYSEVLKHSPMAEVEKTILEYYDLGASPYYLSMVSMMFGHSTVETCKTVKKLLNFKGWGRGRYSVKVKKLTKAQKNLILLLCQLKHTPADICRLTGISINSILFYLFEDEKSFPGIGSCMNCEKLVVWTDRKGRLCKRCQSLATRMNRGAVSADSYAIHS